MTDQEKEQLKQALNADIGRLANLLLPGGKFHGNNWVCDDLHGGAGRSFNLCMSGDRTGLWLDHATGECGDILELIMQNRGLDFHSALEWAQEFTGQYNVEQVVPTAVVPRKQTAYDTPPEGAYVYLNESGEPVLWVERIEENGKKRFIQWSRLNGKYYKTSAYCPKPYPLWQIYGLEPDELVVIHEGEKCAEFASEEGLDGYHTCTLGGSTNARTSDFRPLAGHSVAICPDNDEPGQKYAHDLVALLKDAGVADIRIIELDNLPHKGDVVDWFEMGKTTADWSLAVANAAVVYTRPAAVEPEIVDTSKDFRYVPEELLHMPGLVNDVVDYTMSVSPYPNRVHAFGAAVCLQALLASNRVVGDMGTRPNIYINCLGASASGKNKPRGVNRNILDAIGASSHIYDNMASMEGLEDLLEQHSNILFQPDEFDSFLAASATGDTRFRRISTFLMSVFTSADSTITRRPKANEPNVTRTIRQPHLSLLATSTPTRYFESLDSAAMADGFVGRMVTLCSRPVLRKMSDDEKDYSRPVPDSVLERASHWWNLHRPEAIQQGDRFQYIFPNPIHIPLSAKALEARREAEQYFVDRYNDNIEDETKASVYGRGLEHVNKWSLLTACSDNPYELCIKPEHIESAFKFVRYQIKTVLNANEHYVYKNEDDKQVKRVKQALQRSGGAMQKGELMRAVAYNKRKMEEVLNTMVESGLVETEVLESDKRGPKPMVVRLVG